MSAVIVLVLVLELALVLEPVLEPVFALVLVLELVLEALDSVSLQASDPSATDMRSQHHYLTLPTCIRCGPTNDEVGPIST